MFFLQLYKNFDGMFLKIFEGVEVFLILLLIDWL